MDLGAVRAAWVDVVSGDGEDFVRGALCSIGLLVPGTGGFAAELGLASKELVTLLNTNTFGTGRGGAGKVDMRDAAVEESCASLLSLPDWMSAVFA